MNVGIEHLLNLPFNMATDEDESASGKKVVCGLDEDGADELFGEDREGGEFAEVGFWGGSGAWEGIGKAAAGREGGEGGEEGM